MVENYEKKEALHEILELMKHHSLTLNEIQAALNITAESKSEKSSSIVSRVFAYLGGILIFSGISAFIGMFWQDLGSFGRIACTLGTGLIIYVMAMAATTNKKNQGLIVPLFLVSTILEPSGILVALKEFSSGGDQRYGILFMCAVMLIQHLCSFYITRLSTLIFTMLFFGLTAFYTSADLLNIKAENSSLIAGLSLLMISYGLNKSKYSVITPFWYFVGSIIFLASVIEKVRGTYFELSFLGLSVAFLVMSINVRSRTLLFVSTGSIISYIGYFTAKHFTNSIGWPLTLIIIGLLFIGMGSFALKLNKKYLVDGK